MLYRRFLILALVTSVIGLPSTGNGGSNFDQSKYRTYDGFTVAADPVLPPHEIHPCLWFKQTEIETLVKKRNADDYSRGLWRHISQDALLTQPLPKPPGANDGHRVQNYYAMMSRLAQVNALMSLIGEKAEQEQYRSRAVAALKRAYDGPIYNMDPKTSSVEAIWRGTWAQNYAAAYDWVQSSLSPADDQFIRARLAKEAQYISDHLYVWATSPHNHLSKPAWGLGTLALTLSDHPDAKLWLATAIKAANQNTKYFFSADGIYREGPHYLLFSAINFIPFLYHYRNVSGVDNFGVFQPVFETIIATRNGKGWLPNLYDSYIKPFPSILVAAPYMTHTTELNPDAKLGNLLQWNSHNTDFAVFGKAQEQTGFNYTGDSLGYDLEVDEFLTYDPSILPIAPSISPTIFLKGGQTVFRNDWSFNDPKTRYLLFQGVPLADNHFHHDHLSFIIEAENQMMASDSGYSRKDYHDPIRTQWYITPEAHNVVTADGQAPIDTADNVTPISRDSLDTPFFAFQEKEAPYPNQALQKRAIAFPGKDYYVVIDQLTAPQKVNYELSLHGGRGEMQSDGNRRVWTYTNDRYGSAAKLAAWLLSDGATLKDKEGEITYIRGDYAKFGYVTAAQTASDTTFMQILIPLSTTARLPIVTDQSGKSVIAATVEMNGLTDAFVAQRGQGMTKVGDLETDGRFAWTSSTDKPNAWAVQDGSVLTYAGLELVRSSVPITIAGRRTSTALEVAVKSDRASFTLRLPLNQNERLKSSSFNGSNVTATTTPGHFSVALSGDGHLAIELAPVK